MFRPAIGLLTVLVSAQTLAASECGHIAPVLKSSYKCTAAGRNTPSFTFRWFERIGCSSSRRFEIAYVSSSPVLSKEHGTFHGDSGLGSGEPISVYFRGRSGVEEFLYFSPMLEVGKPTVLREVFFSSSSPIRADWNCFPQMNARNILAPPHHALNPVTRQSEYSTGVEGAFLQILQPTFASSRPCSNMGGFCGCLIWNSYGSCGTFVGCCTGLDCNAPTPGSARGTCGPR